MRPDAAKPVVAIGGITLERVERVVEAGASAVAVIGDLLTGEDPSGGRASSWRGCRELEFGSSSAL